MSWLPIRYRDFHDIPRAFVVEHHGQILFFDCPFDDAGDNYPDFYTVLRLDRVTLANLEESWENLASLGSKIGKIPTGQVRFDSTRRAAVDAASLVFEVEG